jgi:hypothetical protein
MSIRRIILLGVILETLYLSLYLSSNLLTDIATFIVVKAAAYILLAYIVYKTGTTSRDVDSHAARLRLIIGFAILFRLTFLTHDPVATDDIYRYVWDGKELMPAVAAFLLMLGI